MMRERTDHPVLTVVALLFLACGSGSDDNPYGMGTPAGDGDGDGGASTEQGDGDGDPTGDGDDGPRLDVGVKLDSAPDPCLPSGDAHLTGTVYAPNGTLPISGALVYAQDQAPPGIQQTVFCDACVELECGTPYDYSGADGSFDLELESGDHTIVVRKGQFMRVMQMNVAAGATALDAGQTSLPDHNAPNEGLYIPRVAVALGDHDHLENALAKLGLGQTSISGYDEQLIEGTEQFDIWDNSPIWDHPNSLGSFDQLVSNYALLEQYHVIFLPCTMQAGEYPAVLDDPAVKDNIRQWVASGGKWYVADWSGEAIEKPFSQYQDFYLRSDSTSVDSWANDDGQDLGRYDPVGTILDDDLEAWLDALPDEYIDINPVNDPQEDPLPKIDMLPDIQTMFVYSGVKDTPPVLVDDGEGGQVDVGHKVWIEGPGSETWGVPPADEKHPLSMTAEYGCGRIMFTAYHTVEGRDYIGLTPQELVLLYLILEIGECVNPHDAPEPVG